VNEAKRSESDLTGLLCVWCGKCSLSIEPYNDKLWIAECSNCFFDDKEDKTILVSRYT
jgi:hypothetical protein